MATYTTLSGLFKGIADAIRAQTGNTAQIVADDFPEAISALPVHDLSDATAAAGDVLKGKIAYNSSGKVTGTMPNNGAQGGNISTVSGTVTIAGGYTTGGTVQIATAEQSKIVAANIKKGVTILGVAGSIDVQAEIDAYVSAAIAASY